MAQVTHKHDAVAWAAALRAQAPTPVTCKVTAATRQQTDLQSQTSPRLTWLLRRCKYMQHCFSCTSA